VILSSGTKKPKIHSSAYVAAGATISGDVEIGAGCAILHGAVLTAEGAPLRIGTDTVVMENAVVKASGGSAIVFACTIGNKCIVGPQAYVAGATVGNGCFIAGGTRVLNGTKLADNTQLPPQSTDYFADVFNQEPGAEIAARAAEAYSRFLRKSHAQDKRLDDHQTVKAAPARRSLSADEPPATQSTDVGGVVDAMMLELLEIEQRRQEGIKKQKGR
jgi:UDP-3-O-[3-hydroxymyristoyl] glucosamine N-acyltransferase